jgi:preprotein translocase subunit SecD
VGPASELSRESIDGAIAIGLLELVDFGAKPVSEGTQVATDFDYPYFAPVEGTKWHTVLTNAEFAEVQVQAGSGEGQYEIAFVLTPSGRDTLSDFTAAHIGEYLGIVLDKRVLSCPVIKTAITGGSGVIQGGFTRNSAESLAVSLRVPGPLPIPLEVVNFVEAGK